MLDAATLGHYQQLAAWLAQRTQIGSCPIIGINGAQGSGKSTLARFLLDELAEVHGLRVAQLSLDDCYLGRVDRQQLADVHPLLATRGVPGTHDVALGRQLLAQLKRLAAGEMLALPSFSKAEDDRLPETEWPVVTGPFDLILFEGWCVGTPPQSQAALASPVNALESKEDSDGRWRGFVNSQLADPYASWFGILDALIFLQVPGFKQVATWRGQQEAETAAVAGRGQGLMSADELQRFIQHYERLTRHALEVLPTRADVLLTLDSEHKVSGAQYRAD